MASSKLDTHITHVYVCDFIYNINMYIFTDLQTMSCHGTYKNKSYSPLYSELNLFNI